MSIKTHEIYKCNYSVTFSALYSQCLKTFDARKSVCSR